MNNGLLKVENLRMYYRSGKGVVQAVDGVSFELGQRQAITVLGESGCGKSSLARAILRLLPRNVDAYDGKVFVQGQDVMPLAEEEFRKQVRWTKISIVMQAAMNALNPVLRVADQVIEPLQVHQGMTREAALARGREVFQQVGVPVDFMSRYAFELSGGMRQRVVLAMALVLKPPLVLMDEPTSALDVLTQANIMNVLKQIKRETGTSFVLITHDISTSSELSDRIGVMYAGQMVELSDAKRFYTEPLHPYSQKLMASVPQLRQETKLEYIPGRPPSLIDPPKGCRFAARCHKKFDKCDKEPPMIDMKDGRHVRCWLYENG
jgi:oligopeptide/dipeptide ABC transporter ATP-binding protein